MGTDTGSDGVAAGASLWHGRFEKGPSRALMEMSESLSFDKVLWSCDILGSKAHVEMLGRQGIISADDVDAIVKALETVREEMETGTFAFVETDEDIHTAIERRVTQIAGPAGARMHTGRSRNDQVATALRLWCRQEVDRIVDAVLALVRALDGRAVEADGVNPPIRLPGYTHMQHAQPVLLSHHLRAHCFSLLRDVDRLLDARARLNVSPLGAGALAGSSLPLDPASTASALGFSAPFANSMDAVSDRDFVAEILFVVALLGVHLSRMGEEWVLWTTAEFGFARLDDSVATGSSMLPQKKNADIAELARGKSGRLIGNLTGLLATVKGLPLAYNRDLQEDKEPIFDSVRQVKLVLEGVSAMVLLTTFDAAEMSKAADAEALVATDIAEWLVRRGTPFRDAHAVVGAVVRQSIESGVPMRDIVRGHPLLGVEVAELFEPGVALTNRSSPGASGPDAVAIQHARLLDEIGRLENRRES